MSLNRCDQGDTAFFDPDQIASAASSFAGAVRPPMRESRLGNAIRCQGSTWSSHSRRRRRRASPARARSGIGEARGACEQDPHAQGPEHRPHAGWPRGGLYRARRGAHAASRGSGNATPSRRLSASWRRAARKRRSSPSRGEPDLGKRRGALAFQVVGDGGFRGGRSRPCALPTGGRGSAPCPLCASHRGARPILRASSAWRRCSPRLPTLTERRRRQAASSSTCRSGGTISPTISASTADTLSRIVARLRRDGILGHSARSRALVRDFRALARLTPAARSLAEIHQHRRGDG